MEAGYAEHYRRLYGEHWWWRAREQMILPRVRRLAPAQGRGRILDVGCGDGLFFRELARLGEVEGVEPMEELLTPDGPYRDRIHVAPFDRSFQPGRRYSLLLMLDVLEHLPDPVDALRHALDLLEPDGHILITVPAFNLLWSGHDELNHHFTRYRKRSFRALAEAAGMRIEEERYFFHWAWPVKLAARAAEVLLRRPPRVPRVPPSWVNRGLLALSRAEQKAFDRLPLPFGSSLLVVGRKR